MNPKEIVLQACILSGFKMRIRFIQYQGYLFEYLFFHPAYFNIYFRSPYLINFIFLPFDRTVDVFTEMCLGNGIYKYFYYLL